ncbi:GIY-YIG nuclease family protein [Parvicella tangerina]|uniref:GIY-YIG domain-containing protein n=1 Tax=Parvicella tangerina TaxID=2829795 RepID=A0A916NBC8_9FLAO|nr:GIY-YIG nuclease family protein [Parvicella tangerina]CAG5082847.1 hypothetical protein CRYO30217_02025 [Parvicella tangerina]
MHYIYILFSETLDKYYKGQTNNIQNRLARHNAGYEKYTKNGTPWKLVCLIEKKSRSEAVILEKKLKNMNRDKLEAFIKKYG